MTLKSDRPDFIEPATVEDHTEEPSLWIVIPIAIALAIVAVAAALGLNYWLGTDGLAAFGKDGLTWASLLLSSISLLLFIWDTPGASPKQASPKWYIRLGWKRPAAAVLAFFAAVQPAATLFLSNLPVWSGPYWMIMGTLGAAIFGIFCVLWFASKAIQKNIKEWERGRRTAPTGPVRD